MTISLKLNLMFYKSSFELAYAALFMNFSFSFCTYNMKKSKVHLKLLNKFTKLVFGRFRPWYH